MEKIKKVAFITLGCKVNQYETNAMAQKFIEKGYTVVEEKEKADIYVINTCTVTNMSDRKSRHKSKCYSSSSRMLCTSSRKRIRKNTRNRYNFRKQ